MNQLSHHATVLFFGLALAGCSDPQVVEPEAKIVTGTTTTCESAASIKAGSALRAEVTLDPAVTHTIKARVQVDTPCGCYEATFSALAGTTVHGFTAPPGADCWLRARVEVGGEIRGSECASDGEVDSDCDVVKCEDDGPSGLSTCTAFQASGDGADSTGSGADDGDATAATDAVSSTDTAAAATDIGPPG